MTLGDMVQAILVGVLVLVTLYYAIQTHRQANLLKQQNSDFKAQIAEGRTQREADVESDIKDALLGWIEQVFGFINVPPENDAAVAVGKWWLKTGSPLYRQGRRIMTELTDVESPLADSVEAVLTPLLTLAEQVPDGGEATFDRLAAIPIIDEVGIRLGRLEMLALGLSSSSPQNDGTQEEPADGTQA